MSYVHYKKQIPSGPPNLLHEEGECYFQHCSGKEYQNHNIEIHKKTYIVCKINSCYKQSNHRNSF